MPEEMNVSTPKLPRGARPSPRYRLSGAIPHQIIGTTPPSFIRIPKKLSFWGNSQYGDCVTAEEAFAKSCHDREIFIGDQEVISWASTNGFLNGANLTEVLDKMQANGFRINGSTYDDGPFHSVDWTNRAILTNAIYHGPVKIGVAADQLDTAYQKGNQKNGWFAIGFVEDTNEDHCVSLCGYGSLSWLAKEFEVQLPSGVNGNNPGYGLFTWDSIAIIDEPSVLAITQEAWLRLPTTVIKKN